MTITSIRADGITRPSSILTVTALLVLGALANLATLPLVPDDAPAAVMPILLALSAAWIVGAWGIWQGLKLAVIFVFIVTALNGFASAPGILFAEEDSTALEVTFRAGAGVGVAHAIAVCWLLVMKSTREALR